jgi:hypothetical protein
VANLQLEALFRDEKRLVQNDQYHLEQLIVL